MYILIFFLIILCYCRYVYLNLVIENKPQNYKSHKYPCVSMYSKHTTAVYAAAISSVLVASVFAISFVQQQALAQGNQTSAGGAAAGGNKTSSGNQTSAGGAAAGGNKTMPPGES